MNLYLDDLVELGADAGRGNLLGIQPYMLTSDYVAEEAFGDKLDGYLEAARQQGWLNPRTVAVFPEDLGSWLVILDEKAGVHQAKTIQQGMLPIILQHGGEFIRQLWSARESNKINASIFRMKSARMAQAYQAVFSHLAAKYEVTMVAGSIMLASPSVQDGVIKTGPGAIYNVSAVFKPGGQVHPALSVKAYPVSDELPFVARGAASHLPVFETPAGRMGVLICADSFYPQAYEQMKTLQADLLAVPSFGLVENVSEQIWQGYNGAEAPADVDPNDVGRITEGEAWHKYALLGRMASAAVKHGVNVFLHGELWDLVVGNNPSLLVNGQEWVESADTRAALLNLWLY